MNLGDFLEQWGKTLFEAPLTRAPKPDEPPELAEIRLAILDEAQRKSYRAGGKKVFPYEVVRVELRGVERSLYGVFTGRFFRQYLEQELRGSLRGAGARFPEDLQVEVKATLGLPKPGENWLIVEAASRQAGAPEESAPRLVVREGAANVRELRLEKGRTNIGRVVDVYRKEGLSRRNDLAFVEDSEINRSVSREHAHIVRDRASGEYRLFNDRWYARSAGEGECGAWIVRGGMSQPVHRDSRGAKLEPGDEIRLGRAVVTFEWDQ